MVIPLNDNLRIFGGPLCWELQRWRIVKGVERWESVKWFHNLGQAVRDAGETEIRLSEGNSLADAIEAFSRVSHQYEQVLDGAFSEVARKANKNERREAPCT